MRRLVIGLVVLLGLLLILDRVALYAAERDVGKRLQADAHTTTTPDVTIHGFPFLTQLVSGTFGDVDIDMHGIHAGRVEVARLTIQLHDAHVSMGDVISQRRTKIHVKHAAAQLLVPLGALGHSVIDGARVTGRDSVTVSTPVGEFTVSLPGLPFGIRLTGAKVTQAGLVLDGSAEGLVVPT